MLHQLVTIACRKLQLYSFNKIVVFDSLFFIKLVCLMIVNLLKSQPFECFFLKQGFVVWLHFVWLFNAILNNNCHQSTSIIKNFFNNAFGKLPALSLHYTLFSVLVLIRLRSNWGYIKASKTWLSILTSEHKSSITFNILIFVFRMFLVIIWKIIMCIKKQLLQQVPYYQVLCIKLLFFLLLMQRKKFNFFCNLKQNKYY